MKRKIKRPTQREVANERHELERWARAIATVSGRPGCGRTQWALLTAHLRGATLVILRKEQLAYVKNLISTLFVDSLKVITYDDLADFSSSTILGKSKKVVLDDYLEAFEGGKLEGVMELEESCGVEVVGITFTSE
jgi:hypothetical protein